MVHLNNGILFTYEVLTGAATWMNFENIMLPERSQSPKATQIVWAHLREMSGLAKV